MAAFETEDGSGLVMDGKHALRLAGGFGVVHDFLSPSRMTMRGFDPVIQTLMLAVIDVNLTVPPSRGRGRPRHEIIEDDVRTELPPLSPFELRAIDYTSLAEAMAYPEDEVPRTRHSLLAGEIAGQPAMMTAQAETSENTTLDSTGDATRASVSGDPLSRLSAFLNGRRATLPSRRYPRQQ